MSGSIFVGDEIFELPVSIDSVGVLVNETAEVDLLVSAMAGFDVNDSVSITTDTLVDTIYQEVIVSSQL